MKIYFVVVRFGTVRLNLMLVVEPYMIIEVKICIMRERKRTSC